MLRIRKSRIHLVSLYMSRIENFNEQIVYVYGLKDKSNDNIRYVGITINPDGRLVDHLKPCHFKENTHKSNWIKSIISNGGEIEMTILEECSSWEDACASEIKYISELDDLTNLTDGGEGSLNRVLSDETRFLLGTANRGKKISKLYGDKVSSGLRKAYAEGRRKMTNSQLKSMNEASSKACSKAIVQLDLDGNFIDEWPSIAKAARYLKCSSSTICDCLKGKTKTAKTFKWIYKNEYRNDRN